MAKSVSDKTKLQVIRIKLINDKDRALNLAQKFIYEGDNDRNQYWLGRFDALVFALTFVENVINFEEDEKLLS